MLCMQAHKQLTQASSRQLFCLGRRSASASLLHALIMHQLLALSTSVAGVRTLLPVQIPLQHTPQGGGSQCGGEA